MTKVLFKVVDRSKGVIQCLACNRYCMIPKGGAGFCGVRANPSGKKLDLIVHSRPAAVWIDPIEKKPFFHFLPGSSSFSLGTYGCNFACKFCFAPDVTILNDDDVKSFDELFDSSDYVRAIEGGDVGFVSGKKTRAASGKRRAITKTYRHFYAGDLMRIKPRHSPQFSCTPDHRVLVAADGGVKKTPARDLRKGDLLLIPKLVPEKAIRDLDVVPLLEKHVSRIKKGRIKLDSAKLRLLLRMKKEGKTSREMGLFFGMHPAYIRNLLSKLKRKQVSGRSDDYANLLEIHGKRVRFKMEKGPGIPKVIHVDEKFAELLGYYCAEAHTHKLKSRPSSFITVFSYGKHERNLIQRTSKLLHDVFGVEAKILQRRTTTTVEVRSSSLGALFVSLCGKNSHEKKVPSIISKSSKSVITEFLRAFVRGDGSILKDKISMNTVSKRLALGLYHLFLLSGYLPSFYEWVPPKKTVIEGRSVNQSTLYYVKLGSEKFREVYLGRSDHISSKKSTENLKFKETPTHWLVPIYAIDKVPYKGYVYNCEVEGEHTYLANFIAVCNCQNWDLSQAPRQLREKEPSAWLDYFKGLIAKCDEWPPEKIVDAALRAGCKSISFTYSEPTIFTEYAIDTMKIAKKKGLKGVYVTNGYESKECWDAIKGYIDAVNIDLKAYNQRFYTELCGVPDYTKVKESILYAKKLGFWVEVTTLIIPGWNDDPKELKAEAEWLASVDPYMPWHVTAFHPEYKMMDTPETEPGSLVRARALAIESGLKHVYCGNVGAGYSEHETTICPKCKKKLITRYGMSVAENDVVDGRCRFCKEKIVGVWE